MVVLSTAAGFLLASPASPDLWRLLWTAVGTALVAGSANTLNQMLEVDRDRRMHRTRCRPLPSGAISLRHALVVAIALAYAGLSLLAAVVNLGAAALALLTLLLYVVLYTPLKTRTTLNTLLGAVCGAIPPMIGWVGASGSLTWGAWLLAALLFVWQLPHFLSLAWLYREDYARGGFMMLPNADADGVLTGQVVAFTSFPLLLIGMLGLVTGLAGWIFCVCSLLLGTWLLRRSLAFCAAPNDFGARRVFRASLVYLGLLLCILVADRGPGAAIAVTRTDGVEGLGSSAVTAVSQPPLTGSIVSLP